MADCRDIQEEVEGVGGRGWGIQKDLKDSVQLWVQLKLKFLCAWRIIKSPSLA